MTLACEGLRIWRDLTGNSLLSSPSLHLRHVAVAQVLSPTEHVLTGLSISRALCLMCSPLSFAWKLAPSYTSNLSGSPILSEVAFPTLTLSHPPSLHPTLTSPRDTSHNQTFFLVIFLELHESRGWALSGSLLCSQHPEQFLTRSRLQILAGYCNE